MHSTLEDLPKGVIRPALLLALSCFLFCSGCTPHKTKRVYSKNNIAFQKIPRIVNNIEIQYRKNKNEKGVMVINRPESFEERLQAGEDYTLKIDGKKLAFLPDFYGWITEIGTITLGNRKYENVFFVTESGGTGQTDIGLKIINPKNMEILSLGLSFHTDNAYPFPYSIERTGFENSGLEKEKQFLEEIKYSYGYMDEEKKDELIEEPNYAAYFWIKNNEHKNKEKLWIKKYRVPSLVNSGTGIAAKHEDYKNDILYTSFFKWGVQAYDRAKNEAYIIFYCHVSLKRNNNRG